MLRLPRQSLQGADQDLLVGFATWPILLLALLGLVLGLRAKPRLGVLYVL